MTPGTGLLNSLDEALAEAEKIGYPIMLKSTAGGGGIGLTRCDDAEALQEAYESVKRLGEQFFKRCRSIFRALYRSSPSCRSSDFWRWSGTGGGFGRARLFTAAP